MKIMIDTNIILDVYLNRKQFVAASAGVLRLSEKKQIKGTITASMVTDIYYLLGRHIKDDSRVKELLQKLISVVSVTDVLSTDITKAFSLPIPDYEDALVAQCASRVKASFIVTRDEKHYRESPVPVITPQELLSKF